MRARKFFSIFGTAEGSYTSAEFGAEFFHEEYGGVVIKESVFGKILRRVRKRNEGVFRVESGLKSDAKTPGLRSFEAAMKTDAERSGLFDHRMESVRPRENNFSFSGFRVDVFRPKAYLKA